MGGLKFKSHCGLKKKNIYIPIKKKVHIKHGFVFRIAILFFLLIFLLLCHIQAPMQCCIHMLWMSKGGFRSMLFRETNLT